MNTKQFFYRNVIFSKQGQTISIVDIHNPDKEKQVLEPWFGIVLQLADGQHTIDQLHQFMAAQYNGNPPGDLERTLHSVIDRLSLMKFIVLTDKATELPYYLSIPYEMMDLNKAKMELENDRTPLN